MTDPAYVAAGSGEAAGRVLSASGGVAAAIHALDTAVSGLVGRMRAG